jgi:hypothetical protein
LGRHEPENGFSAAEIDFGCAAVLHIRNFMPKRYFIAAKPVVSLKILKVMFADFEQRKSGVKFR